MTSILSKIAKDIFVGKDKSPKGLVRGAKDIIDQICQQLDQTQKLQQYAQIQETQTETKEKIEEEPIKEAQTKEREVEEQKKREETQAQETQQQIINETRQEEDAKEARNTTTTTNIVRTEQINGDSQALTTTQNNQQQQQQQQQQNTTASHLSLTHAIQENKILIKYYNELTEILSRIKKILYGTKQTEPKTAEVEAVVKECINIKLIDVLLLELQFLPFEARKDASKILCNILKVKIDEKYPVVSYLQENEGLMHAMVDGYGRANLALLYGPILRECITYVELHRALLFSEKMYELMNYLEVDNFEVATDAFKTFKLLLRTHKRICADFMHTNFDRFFKSYTKLLHAQNYVAKLQSLKLLADILQDRSNFKVMKQFISLGPNLKLIMTLLLNKSTLIQYQTFQVFKVFVANPHKTEEIKTILHYNRDKLIAYLENFLAENDEELFKREKEHIIGQLKKL